MRVLVTGATGLIGNAVAHRLASAGHVVALARSDVSAATVANAGYMTARGDLADPAGIADAARGVDAVVHVAASNDANRAAHEMAATHAVMDALRGNAKRFVYTSGCLLYDAIGATPATEDSALDPIGLVRFRRTLEDEVLTGPADGVHAIVVRPVGCTATGAAPR